jgi:hypothetical protein
MEILCLKTSDAYILLNIGWIWTIWILLEREFWGESDEMLCRRELDRWWWWFELLVGNHPYNSTHIPVNSPSQDWSCDSNYKGFLLQDMLAVCSFDMRFPYVCLLYLHCPDLLLNLTKAICPCCTFDISLALPPVWSKQSSNLNIQLQVCFLAIDDCRAWSKTNFIPL